ncbi:hypothetical protein Trydic_g3668 [Trypoxylus dichotomus]
MQRVAELQHALEKFYFTLKLFRSIPCCLPHIIRSQSTHHIRKCSNFLRSEQQNPQGDILLYDVFPISSSFFEDNR